MAQLHAEAAAVIPAAPEQVYRVLRDYRHEHPNILPKPYFGDVEVLAGGEGAGTRFRVQTRVLGTERTYEMIVTEPVPGRLLVETDRDTGLVTTFSITPTANPQQTRVQIATDWVASPGLTGLIERLITPRTLRGIYVKELNQLAAYLADKSSKVETTASAA